MTEKLSDLKDVGKGAEKEASDIKIETSEKSADAGGVNLSEANDSKDISTSKDVELSKLDSIPISKEFELPPGFPPAAIAGLLQACGSEMTQVEQELKDLTGKQNEMYEKIREHNQMLESSLPLDELTKLFDNMKVGLDKLQSIRQEMHSIHERSTKLKERAAKLAGMRRQANEANEELIAVVNLEESEAD